MLTEPRLDILKHVSLGARIANAGFTKVFGFVPAAIHVFEPSTAIGVRAAHTAMIREAFRPTADWSRPELELLGAFVSARNRCVF